MIKLNIQLFASNSNSKNLYSNAYPSKYPYLLSVSFTENKVTDTHIQNNKTSITVSGSLKAQGAYWSTSYESTLQLYWYDSKTKKETLKKSYSFAGLSGHNDSKSTSVTFDVEHNDDGTLSGYAKIKYVKGSTTSSYAPASNEVATSSTALTTIPRATPCPNLDGYIESSIPITLNPYIDTFKHRLYYSYNGKTGYYPSSDGFFNNTGSLDLDTSFYALTPKSSGTGDLTLYTYASDGTLKGSTKGKITVRCDKDKCEPEITAKIFDDYALTVALTKDNTKLVKGYSLPVIEYTMTPKNGATIASQSVSGESMQMSPHAINLGVLNKYEVLVTDSRGFTNTEIIDVSVIDYVPLRIDMTALRPASASNEVKVNFSGTYFNGKFSDSVSNTLTLTWKYRIKGDENWIDGGTIDSTNYSIDATNNKISSNGDVSLDTELFSYQNNYDVAIFYEDKLVSSYTYKVVPKGIPVVNWADELFNVNGVLKIHNVPVIESGYNSNGDYIKFANGTMLCMKSFYVGEQTVSAYGSLYRSAEITLPDFPVEFKEIKTCHLSFEHATWSSSPVISVVNYGYPTITSPGKARLILGANNTHVGGYIQILAIGKWK